MRVRHRCHVMWISASTLSSFGCAAGPDHTPSEAAGNGSALRRLSEAAAMNLNALRGQPSQESFVLDSALRRKCSLWYRRSLRGSGERTRRDMGSLTRGHKLDQPKQSQPRSLVDYCDPQRITVVMEKQDNQTFGFEIQTYGLQLKDSSEVEMCTSVSKVHEDSAAESAGLTAGDIIITINGASIEGLSHQNILDLVRKSDNSLMMETVCGSKVKQIELEKRMSVLKQTLREKLVELQALIVEEKRLTQGQLSGSSPHLSEDSPSPMSPPAGRFGLRFSSDSSFKSAMTDDSELASVFGDLSPPCPFSAASTSDDGCFFSKDFPAQDSPGSRNQRPLGRTSSSSLAGSSSSLSPSWEETRISNLFGTLPRKSRKTSVRKHIFKLLPGLQRSVEEEEV